MNLFERIKEGRKEINIVLKPMLKVAKKQLKMLY